eukprot:jgi/Chlat1/3356/Chrsp23S03779
MTLSGCFTATASSHYDYARGKQLRFQGSHPRLALDPGQQNRETSLLHLGGGAASRRPHLLRTVCCTTGGNNGLEGRAAFLRDIKMLVTEAVAAAVEDLTTAVESMQSRLTQSKKA